MTALLSNMTGSCYASNTIPNKPTSIIQPIVITQLGTLDSEKKVVQLINFLKSADDVKRFQHECDNEDIAQSCYYYASYQDLIAADRKTAYAYYKQAFDLGIKQAGYFVGSFQIYYPELFDEANRLSIDEAIGYLEQAFDAGSADATRMLMMVYRDSNFDHIDYLKAEYYNQIAIKQGVKKSRFILAYLYLEDMKDTSKINKSITLLEEDLVKERNWQSATVLSGIYLDSKRYGADLEDDITKVLAYAYLSSRLRGDRNAEEFNNVDNRFIEAMEKELSPKLIKQSRAIYLEMMTKINATRTQNTACRYKVYSHTTQ